MNFKFWIVLNENVEQNWEVWCDTIEKYSGKNPLEKRILNALKDGFFVSSGSKVLKQLLYSGSEVREIIIRVLKEKNLENYNWFSFSLGCIVSYDGSIHQEDLRAAIDETKRRISSGELPKSEIGQKGWLIIGEESKDYVDEYIRKSQIVSKRKQEKFRKLGRTLTEDPSLIKIFAEEGKFTLYFCPKLKDISTGIINARHAILCKYGKGGKFCTASPTGTHHTLYINNDIYIFHVNDNVKYQFVSCKDSKNLQFMTVENKPPQEIEKDELNFLIQNNTPIECYNLKTSVSYEDVITAAKEELSNPKDILNVRSHILKDTSIARIEEYLLESLDRGKKSDIILLIKAGLNVSVNIGYGNSFYIADFIENLQKYDFAQETIKEIVELLSSHDHFQYIIASVAIENLIKISNLKNLNLIFSNLSRSRNILSDKDYINMLEKYENSQEIIYILSKTDLSSELIPFIIAKSTDKVKTCNILRSSLDALTSKQIIYLLLGYLQPKYGEYINSYERRQITPEVEINSSAREMASALGSKIVSKIQNIGDVVSDLSSALKGNRGTGAVALNLKLTKDKVKGFIEEIASKHESLDRQDVYKIILAYKSLVPHKSMEKISKFLGNKNLKKLDRIDRYSL